MKWIVLVLLLLFAVVAVVAAVRVIRRSAAGAGNWQVERPRRRCLRCRGTGWIGGEPERTLNFDGAGFANRHAPATRCPDCDGTGFAAD